MNLTDKAIFNLNITIIKNEIVLENTMLILERQRERNASMRERINMANSKKEE